ncbi:imelysin family protein [Eisenibacter elegans]|uniref:imelysin family protein n=1 Tax=Eisenibacter elegans TaxID=997 RepID=UPI00040682C9|nr:imelysin family protein [Eisenibacter elegans]
MKKRFSYVFLCIGVFTLLGCTDAGTEIGSSFERRQMLENMAQNLIVPAYQDLQRSVNNLKTSADNFAQNPTGRNLTDLQTAWEEAYIQWQYANAYNFGPAGEEGIRKGLIEEIGTFPVSTTKIENTITNNNANFNDFNRDARGFLTLEYLIFDLNNDDAAILSKFSSQNRKVFLQAVASDIKTRVDAVVAAWNTSYREQFVSNTGTDVGSSTAQLYNEFVKSFESIKNFKAGLPLGRRPGQLQAEPTRVEAYYSGKSRQMMVEHLKAIENIWYGRSKSGQDGVGFKEYLASVEGGAALITATEAQWAVVMNSLNAVPQTPRIAIQIQNTPAAFDNLHTELQRHTRFFKSDMSSLLGIAITFSSGDGD